MYFRLRTVYERLGVGRRAAYVSEASFNGESIFLSAGRLFLNIRSIKVGCDKKHLHTAHSFFIVKNRVPRMLDTQLLRALGDSGWRARGSHEAQGSAGACRWRPHPRPPSTPSRTNTHMLWMCLCSGNSHWAAGQFIPTSCRRSAGSRRARTHEAVMNSGQIWRSRLTSSSR